MSSCTLVPILKSGQESILYRELLGRGFSRSMVEKIYDGIHTDSFLMNFGNWIDDPDSVRKKLDENGEPRVEELSEYLTYAVEPGVEAPRNVKKVDISSNIVLEDKVSQYLDTNSTVSSVLEKIVSVSTNESNRDLARKLKEGSSVVDKIAVNIITSTEILGEYKLGNINFSTELNNLSREDIETVILHEIVHAFTAEILSSSEENLTEGERKFVTDIASLFSMAKAQAKRSGVNTFDNAFDNKAEFVSEALTNPNFQDYLRGLNQGNLWQRLLNLIKNLFGIGDNAVYDRTIAFISSPSFHRGTTGVRISFKSPITTNPLYEAKLKAVRNAVRSVERIINQFKVKQGESVGVALINIKKKKLQELYLRNENNKVILEYTPFAINQIEMLYNRLMKEIENETLTLAKLNEIHKYAKGYKALKEIALLAKEDPDLKDVMDLPAVHDALSAMDRIDFEYNIRSREFVLDVLAPFEARAYASLREEAEIKFNRANIDTKFEKGERDKKKKEFIKDYIEKNKDNLENQSRKNLRQSFDLANQDISNLSYWAAAVQHADDDLLRVTKAFVDRALDDVRRETIAFQEELTRNLDMLREHKGNLNPRELYADFIETTNGEQKPFFVSEYLHSYYEDLYAMLDRIAGIEDDAEKKAAKEAWFKNNADVHPEWADKVLAMQAEAKSIKAQKGILASREYARAWFRTHAKEKWVPKAKFRNPQYNKFNPTHKEYLGDDHALVKFYNFIIESQARFDRGRPSHRILGDRLPAIRKNFTDRFINETNLSPSSIMSVLHETFKRDEDDVQYGDKEVIEDIEGNIKRSVPIFFTSRELDIKDQSFDVGTLLMLNGAMSINYDHINRILPEIEAVRNIASTREVVQRNGFGAALMRKGSIGESRTISGDKSNSYKLLEAFVEDRIHGVEHVDQDFIFSAKTWDAIFSYTSLSMLAGNFNAGFANVTYAKISTLIEAYAGHIFTRKNLIAARHHYLRDLKNIVGDIGRDRYTSKTNKLMEYFDSLNDFKGSKWHYADNNISKRLFKKDTLYAFNSLGEHFAQNLSMYAILDQIEVINENGEAISNDGSPVGKKEKSSLTDFMFVNDQNVLEFSPHLKKVRLKDSRELDWNDDTKFIITSRIRATNTYLHGAYSSQNKVQMQRYIWGRAILMMRKWIGPGVRRRFLGFNRKMWKGNAEKVLSQELGEFEQGNYVTTVNFIAKTIKHWKHERISLPQQWHLLTDWEKANVRKTVYEFGFAVAMFALGKILQGIGEDEPDEDTANTYYFFAYQAQRMTTELAFYVLPTETLRILQDPTPTVSIMSDIISLGSQLLFNPAERYERGRRKGQLKLWKDLENLGLFYRHWDRINNMEETLSFFTQPI